MARLTDTAPVRLLSHEVAVVSDDPFIALVTLDTDEGSFEFAVNKAGAEGLIASLTEAMDTPRDHLP